MTCGSQAEAFFTELVISQLNNAFVSDGAGLYIIKIKDKREKANEDKADIVPAIRVAGNDE
jgi:hypothetical protein